MRMRDAHVAQVDRYHSPPEGREPAAVDGCRGDHYAIHFDYPALALTAEEQYPLPGVEHPGVREDAVYPLSVDDDALNWRNLPPPRRDRASWGACSLHFFLSSSSFYLYP